MPSAFVNSAPGQGPGRAAPSREIPASHSGLIQEAIATQLACQKDLITEDAYDPGYTEVVAVDCAYYYIDPSSGERIGFEALRELPFGAGAERLVAVAASFAMKGGSFIPTECKAVVRRLEFPYVTHLMGFVEGPAMLAAIAKLKLSKPPMILVDGDGRLHVRKMGLACHLGLALDVPTLAVRTAPAIGATHHRQPAPLDMLERVCFPGYFKVECPANRTVCLSVGWTKVGKDGRPKFEGLQVPVPSFTEGYGTHMRNVVALQVSPGHRMSLEGALREFIRAYPAEPWIGRPYPLHCVHSMAQLLRKTVAPGMGKKEREYSEDKIDEFTDSCAAMQPYAVATPEQENSDPFP